MASSNILVFGLRKRFYAGEQPGKLYDVAYNKLAEIPTPWGLQGIPQIPMKEGKGAVSFGVKYTRLEKSSPIKSFVLGFMSRNRSALPNDASVNDDTLAIDFDTKKVSEDWRYLLDKVFPLYIAATSPYWGALFDEAIYVGDVVAYNPETNQSVFNPSYTDPRNGVNRVWQANYWDRELCRRSFKLEPEQIVERLKGQVANCRMLNDGVILICSYEPLFGDAILELNDLVLPLLRE